MQHGKKKRQNGMSPDEPLVMCRKMEIHFVSYGEEGSWLYVGKGLSCASAAIFLYVVLRNKTSGSSIGYWTCHHLKEKGAAPSAISIGYLSIKKF